MTSGTINDLKGVWGSSGSDVFAVGRWGHHPPLRWAAPGLPCQAERHLLSIAVWGSSGSDVFAVGTCGTILHYNGSAWSAMASGTTISPRLDVWGSSGSDVFAVGGKWHYPPLQRQRLVSNVKRDDILSYGVSGAVPAVMCLPWVLLAPFFTTTEAYGLLCQAGQQIVS